MYPSAIKEKSTGLKTPSWKASYHSKTALPLETHHRSGLLTFADDLIRPALVWLADQLGRAMKLVALPAANVAPGPQGRFVVSPWRGPAVHIPILHLDGGAPRSVYRQKQMKGDIRSDRFRQCSPSHLHSQIGYSPDSGLPMVSCALDICR